MVIVLPTIGVLFAAFCVWLTVRIVNRRERWAKWTAVGLLAFVLIGYPLSFGPACWALRNGFLPEWARGELASFYLPILVLEEDSPGSAQDAIDWYVGLWR